MACEEILAQKEEDVIASSSACFFHDKKEDDCTCTTQAESLGDQSVCTSTQECKDQFSIRIEGTLFVGIKSSAINSHPCGLDSGNESSTGAEETLKERNKRLLCKERESLRQRKVRTSKRRGEYLNNSNISQAKEKRNTVTVEDQGNNRINCKVESLPEQRERMRVDRRWEFELLLRMKEKLLNKAEKSVKATVKRLVWGSNYIPKVFQYIIRSYVSSAFRFAVLKSNRSSIPGD